MINWGGFWNFFKTGIPNHVFLPSLIITITVSIAVLFSSYIKNKKRTIIWLLFAEYIFVVLCSTVLCRERLFFEFTRFEPMPFWTYRAVINNIPGVSVWDIILNIFLFVPLGLFLKFLYPSLIVIRTFLIGLGFSLIIETGQFVTERGVVQFDDVLHNSVGCVVGWALAEIILQFRS